METKQSASMEDYLESILMLGKGKKKAVRVSQMSKALGVKMPSVTSALAKLSQEGATPIDLSLPTVVRGDNYQIDYPTQTVWLEVPFNSSLGEFNLRVTFERDDE